MRLPVVLALALSALSAAFAGEPGDPCAAGPTDRDGDGIREPLGATSPGFDPSTCAGGASLVSPVDLCPSDREDVDGFQDHDGCEDADHDGDGLPRGTGASRVEDECENRWGPLRNRGCPSTDAALWFESLEARCRVQFDAGSIRLGPAGREALSHCAVLLVGHPQLGLDVFGFSSDLRWRGLASQDSTERNAALSACRALSVAREFTERYSIPSSRIRASGCGEIPGDRDEQQTTVAVLVGMDARQAIACEVEMDAARCEQLFGRW